MSIKNFSEIVLIVNDVQRAAEFYENVVGLTVESADDEWVWFYVGETEKNQRLAVHRGKLLFEEKSPLPEGKRWGQVHYAFEVGRNDFEKAVTKAKDAGVEVYGPQHFKWMNAVSYYFYDPDGNLIEYWSPDN
jgi:catechol 2,3-dioxygenase-like lactoylglutathione lyase family enzyme